MRIFLLLLVSLCFSSCRKAKKPVKCYVCEMTYSTGIPAAKQFPCVEDIEQWRSEQKDNNGQPLLSVCKEQ